MDLLNDIIYIELNDWSYDNHPKYEPVEEMIFNGTLTDNDYLKENKLVVVESYVDMSRNFCISAPRSWVEENWPKLLTDEEYEYKVNIYFKGETTTKIIHKKYSDFIRKPYLADLNDLDSVEVDSDFGYFEEYNEDNYGLHVDHGEDYDLWRHHDDDDEENENG